MAAFSDSILWFLICVPVAAAMFLAFCAKGVSSYRTVRWSLRPAADPRTL